MLHTCTPAVAMPVKPQVCYSQQTQLKKGAERSAQKAGSELFCSPSTLLSHRALMASLDGCSISLLRMTAAAPWPYCASSAEEQAASRVRFLHSDRQPHSRQHHHHNLVVLSHTHHTDECAN